MAIRPLHDRVLVRPTAAADSAASFIIIPDASRESRDEGQIVSAAGRRRRENGWLKPLDGKAGDRVLFGNRSRIEAKIGGENLLFMKEAGPLRAGPARTLEAA